MKIRKYAIAIWIVLVLCLIGKSNAQDVNRAWEVSFIKNFPNTQGLPNQTATVDTGVLLASDENNLYFVTLYSSFRDIVKFSWTNDVKSFNVPPSPNNIELEGELIDRQDNLDLLLFKTSRPKEIKPKLFKIAEPQKDEDVFIIVKNYSVMNRINVYTAESGIYTNIKRVDTQDLEQFVFRFKQNYRVIPYGGGIVVNKQGALLGLIRTCSSEEQVRTVTAISAKSIEKFVRKIQEGNKDVPATAPKEKTD